MKCRALEQLLWVFGELWPFEMESRFFDWLYLLCSSNTAAGILSCTTGLIGKLSNHKVQCSPLIKLFLGFIGVDHVIS